MSLPTDVLYEQAQELADHLLRRKVTIPTGNSLADYCRGRTRYFSKGAENYHLRYDDGALVESFSSAPDDVSQETLDMTLGKDSQGLWIGGPFASHKIERTRRFTSRWRANKVEYPEYLWPPAVTETFKRYVPSLLLAPPSKPGWFFKPQSVASAHPVWIQNARTAALGRLQAARNRAKPDSSYADFAQSIAELREVSQLVRYRASSLMSAFGTGYLAYAFGWTPIINDLHKLTNMAAATKKRIAWLRRNANKPVKMKRTLYNFSSDLGELYKITYGTPFPFNTIEPAEGERSVYGVMSCKAEYHSVIRYALPEDANSLGWEDKAFRHLIGLRPGLDLIWDITPWTWLVDWFTNVGDFVEDRFSRDLVATEVHDEWITITCTITSWCTVPTVAGSLSTYAAHTSAYTERKDTFKYRMIPPDAAPLTLLDLVPFNSKQQAILAALAASRQRSL